MLCENVLNTLHINFCRRRGGSVPEAVIDEKIVQAAPAMVKFFCCKSMVSYFKIKPSLYSRYCAEACDEWRGPSPRRSAWTVDTQL